MKISVITVSFNAERYIERTIKSVLSQTFENVEYIVVDGQSTDSTMRIVERYSSAISTVISEPDEGIYDAMNKGVSVATGDFLLFLNADDFLVHPDVLRLVSCSIGEGNCELYYGDFLVLNPESGKIAIKDQSQVCLFSVLIDFPGQPSVFYRRDVFERIGLFSRHFKVVSDYEWIVSAYLDHNVSRAYLGLSVTIFQDGGVSTSLSHRELHRSERKAVIAKYMSDRHWKQYKRAVQDQKKTGFFNRVTSRCKERRIRFRQGILAKR